jgi:hypothetical protein
VIYRIFPSKDNWITNLVAPFVNVPVTGSNFGASEILELFKKVGVSGAGGWAGSSSLGRVLMQFDFSRWNQLTSSLDAPRSPLWRLVMKNARHAETLPSSYDVEVISLSRSWDEGPGYDHETFVDKGQSNWVQARSDSYWTTLGGDLLTDVISTYHFDDGSEDLDVDVGRNVSRWLSGTVINNGLCVRVSSSLETNALDYYVKKFHSRQTNFLDRRPYLESRWDDSVRDDRANFVFDYSGTLYLYNKVRGQLTNIPGIPLGQNCMNVRIADLSGTLMTLSASWTGLPGIYSASFTLATGSYSGSRFNDIWTSGSRVYMTGAFVPSDDFSRQSLGNARLVASVPNLKSIYTTDESPDLRVYIREYDYNPPVVLTASISSPGGLMVTRGYYRVDNDRTKEQVVPFGTGSYEGGTDWTRLSYDENGNYFGFHMGALAPGQVYRIVLLIDQDGQRQVLDGGFKFKVV